MALISNLDIDLDAIAYFTASGEPIRYRVMFDAIFKTPYRESRRRPSVVMCPRVYPGRVRFVEP